MDRRRPQQRPVEEQPSYNWRKDKRRGNCYYVSEALYHILGGRAAGWKPMRVAMYKEGCSNRETHWFLKHESGLILDASVLQFSADDWWPKPEYSKAVGSGFLTREPSKPARRLMEMLTWQNLPAAKTPKGFPRVARG